MESVILSRNWLDPTADVVGVMTIKHALTLFEANIRFCLNHAYTNIFSDDRLVQPGALMTVT